MNHVSCSSAFFEKAKAAFDAGDYVNAVKYVEQVQARIFDEVVISEHGAIATPTYSIIVVTFGVSDNVLQALKLVRKYSSRVEFETIIVNNAGSVTYSEISKIIDRFTLIEVPFNYGCSGGRNIGAKAARGEFVIFVDDDGMIGSNAVERLIDVITDYAAISVRGRVLPKSPEAVVAPHYDLGSEILYSAPNAEGISIWRRFEFLLHGGFDPLLSGWEGVALWSKMYRFYAPDGFLYAPDAILFHDFAKDSEHLKRKKTERSRNRAYLKYSYPDALQLKEFIEKIRKQDRARIALHRVPYLLKKYAANPDFTQSHLSVVTTAKNALDLVVDYTKGLKYQTHQAFELIFVDRGSLDETSAQMSVLWHGDDRLRLISGPACEAAALNLAIAQAKHDICVIADIATVSHPRRFELTLRHLLAIEDKSCVSFATFSERDVFSNPATDIPVAVGMKTRCLLGMPRAFHGLGFRKSRFVLPFDESLSAGFECTWMHSNLRQSGIDGAVIPLNQVFSRESDRAVHSERHLQSELDCLYAAQEDLLGSLSEKDKQCCRILSGWEKCTAIGSLSEVQEYVTRLIIRNAQRRLYDQAEIEQALLYRLCRLESSLGLGERRSLSDKVGRYDRNVLKLLWAKIKQYC